ncbi:alpha/beta fold hydrolase [Ornithinibacillus halophilus]|uniref:Pimeloyl-ACP methyl ester carboxylesterase n=1 Tax=Ornithinibacillus halophilus TaxID=930117 RepID=A0A1M5FKL9_9BACI|nr:alpha/beta hydrolase [Ornithinibacillus halophilus]SHF92046.1 Pimeloyl-ACP methyl ester carboxylesterase [Ornithinibacillus halophilus]
MGVKVYAEYCFNEKPPILLLHGFVASSYSFHKLIPLLKNDFSIITIDLPGFGRSEKSTTFTYSYKNYAKLVLACMDYFKLDTIYLAGHSMGGQISLNIALLQPERIKKLILFASSAYLKRAKKSLILSSYLPFFHLYARHEIQKNGVRETLENVIYDHSLITEELIEEYKRPINEKDFSKSLVRLLRHREGDLSPEQLQRIQKPALLLWGEQDKVVSLKIGKKLAKDLPNAKLLSYKNAGHLITEEKPNELYHEIIKFINS